MPTPRSSSSAYATPDDMAARYDARTLCDLCSDTGSRLAPTALASSPRLLQILMDASGEVEAAAFVAGAYSPGDLAAMAGTASGALLARLVCDLAMGMLFDARPDREGAAPKYAEAAEKKLEALRKGQRVFGLAAQQDAGVASARDAGRGRLVETMGRFFFGRGGRSR